jgi:hypothetical protein
MATIPLLLEQRTYLWRVWACQCAVFPDITQGRRLGGAQKGSGNDDTA